MKRKLLFAAMGTLAGAALLLGAGTCGWQLNRLFGKEAVLPARAKTASETRVFAALDEMRKNGHIEFGIPESDGRRLRLLVEAIGARNVVEIGASTGYSGLWLGLGALQTGGRVTTFEIDPRRAAIAREHYRKAGVEDRITLVEGDAHKNLSMVQGPVDLVFIDADKEGYLDYLNQLLPLVRPGGLILAHNVEHAPEFLKVAAANPDLDTVLLTQGSGLSATLKKR